MVSARFSTYSVLHPWESPSGAFRRGRGYCTQYNGALAIILRELGLQAWLVYAARVRFDDQPDWRWATPGSASESTATYETSVPGRRPTVPAACTSNRSVECGS